jgi:lipid II:glycine glycyltransferase (peptidoglycan interpeptide bridge formation enzyme)
MWADVKRSVGWSAERVAVLRNGRVVGGAQVLRRRLAIFDSIRLPAIALVPSSPWFVDGGDSLDEVVAEVTRLCVHRHVAWLKFQPTTGRSVDSNALERVLLQQRFVRSDIHACDSATMRVGLSSDPDRVMASLRRGLRSNIRKAQRRRLVAIREGNEHDLATFVDLMTVTARRQPRMPLFPGAYYKQAWQSFASRGRARLLLAEYAGHALSAILLVTHGDTCEYLYGGWNGQHPDLHPNELLQWSAIEWACEQGFSWYDLGKIDRATALRVLAGEHVPRNATTGVTRYKLGFDGEVLLTPPAYDQTGRRAFRPVLRALAPRLWLVHPLIRQARGVVSGSPDHDD